MTTGNLTPPHEYFEKIPPSSPYFLHGQTAIYAEVAKGWLSDRDASLRIIANLDRVGMRTPIYYLAQLKVQTNPTYNWLSSMYKDMEGRLSEYMDFKSFSPTIHWTVGKPVSYSIFVHDATRAVAFLFLGNMIIAAKSEKSFTRCAEGKDVLSKLIESNGMDHIEFGMKAMSQEGAPRLLSIASAIQCKTE